MLKKILKKYVYLKDIVRHIDNLNQELDTLKSKIDLDDEALDLFGKMRSLDFYREVYKKEKPLVSICVATYNRSQLLVERCVNSVLGQDYQNIEVIIVGDCCTDDTKEKLEIIKDKRLKFINLPQRGKYPDDPNLRWMVAGTQPVNYALSIANGDFITHLDDDDEYSPDRISKLVNFIQRTQADLVWHPFWTETNKGIWKLNKSENFAKGSVTTSSVFYHNWFRNIPWDIGAYKYYEPGDWNRFRKIRYLGAQLVYYPEPLLRHFKEKNQS